MSIDTRTILALVTLLICPSCQQPHDQPFDEDTGVSSYALTADEFWSKRFGDGNFQGGYAIATSASGNVIVGGGFNGSMDLGGGVLTATSGGAWDAFVGVFDALGHHLWSRRFGGIGNDLITAAALDGNGNIVLTGYFNDVIDFGGAPLVSSGFADAFVAKLSPTGAHLWSKRFGNGDQTVAYSVAIGGDGAVFLGVNSRGPVDFGGGASGGCGDRLNIVKFSASGVHLWTHLLYRQHYCPVLSSSRLIQ